MFYEIRKFFLFSPPNKTWTARLFLSGDSNFFWDSVQRDGTLKKWVEMHPVYCIVVYCIIVYMVHAAVGKGAIDRALTG